MIALRPTEKTLAGLSDSIARITAAQKSADARIAEIESGMSELMMNGTASEIDAARDERAMNERLILDLKHLCEAVKAQEIPIQREIALDRYRKAAEASEERTKFWVLWFLADYEPHASAIAYGMNLEQDALRAYLHALSIRRQYEELLDGAELPELTSPRSPYPTMKTRSFSGEVKLPGMKGAPDCAEEDAPFWLDISGSEKHQSELFVQREELNRRGAMIVELQRENAQLRAMLSTVGLSSAVGPQGVVARSGPTPDAVGRSWDAVMRTGSD